MRVLSGLLLAGVLMVAFCRPAEGRGAVFENPVLTPAFSCLEGGSA